MAALARFQDAFAGALLAPDAAPLPEVAALAAQPGFNVYRNTVMKGCVDALQANYPAVARVVGEEWFRAAAAIYVREHLPSHPTLLHYGADFADFLAHFEPAAELPYLPAVARLDRYWTEAHMAATRSALDPDAIAGLAPETLAGTVLLPHPAARWAWFDDAPIYTIWSRNRAAAEPDGEMNWQAEGALLTRPHEAVTWIAIDAACCALLDACAAGHTMVEAAQAALLAEPEADLSAVMAALLAAGAFASLRHGTIILSTEESI